VIPDCSVGTAEDQCCDFSADDSIGGEIVKSFDDFKCFGEIASHSGTSLSLANGATSEIVRLSYAPDDFFTADLGWRAPAALFPGNSRH
jgi:hypothetical protein